MIHGAVLIATMAVVTLSIRSLPFLLFRKRTPGYVLYLGKVLPPAVIGMLVVYGLKDADVTAPPFGLPELIAGACVAGIQIWKRDPVLSILGGTAVYMLSIRTIF